MPNAIINDVHEATGIGKPELENIWRNAIKFANKNKIKNPDRYANGVLQHVKNNAESDKAQDSSTEKRYVDRNKYVIAPNSVITGADVAEYRGWTIPKNRLLRLDPDKMYKVYRPIDEIKDNDFNGKPVLSEHIGDFSADTAHNYADYVMGAAHDTGREGSEITGTVTLWNREAINDLNRGKKYLSAGYWYDAVIESGHFNGEPYEIVMRNIEANHIALVDDPRYEPAVVGDSKNDFIGKINMYKPKFNHVKTLITKMLGMGMDAKDAEDAAKAADAEAEEELKKTTKGTDGDEPPATKTKTTEHKVAAVKAEDDDDDDDKKDKKAKDKKAMDADTFSRAEVEEIIKDKMAKAKDSLVADAKAEIAKDAKAMDSAKNNFRILYGEPSMAMDSASDVNRAILKNANIACDGKSDDYLCGVVESLVATKRAQRYGKTGANVSTMTMDSKNNDLSLLPKHLADKMKGGN